MGLACCVTDHADGDAGCGMLVGGGTVPMSDPGAVTCGGARAAGPGVGQVPVPGERAVPGCADRRRVARCNTSCPLVRTRRPGRSWRDGR